MVNTFLPHPDFHLSVRALDDKRLGKQRLEARQIVNVLQDVAVLEYCLEMPYPGGPVSAHFSRLKGTYSSLRFFLFRSGEFYSTRQLPEGKPVKLGWLFHPAVRMWYGHLDALRAYTNRVIEEWVARGKKNTMPLYSLRPYSLPPWFGSEEFHLSHRSNLFRKDPVFYSFFGAVPPLPYLWPVS